MYYQKVNHFTGSFTFPILLCDVAVQDIDTEAKYFIYVNMYSGYWQVVEEKEAREILAFFTSDIKRQWKVMPMGPLNVDPTFISMMC